MRASFRVLPARARGSGGSARAAGFIGAALVCISSSPAPGLQLQLSSPYYRVWSTISESSDGESVTGRFDDEDVNDTGETMGVSIGTAYADSAASVQAPFAFGASSSVDGLSVLQGGLASASGEGGFWFETDLLVTGVEELALVEIRYRVSESFLSTDPRFHWYYDPTGTTASSSSSLGLFLGFDIVASDPGLDPGEHVLSALVGVGVVHRLRTTMNASSSAAGSSGSASAAVSLQVLSISARPVPEPETGLLLALGMATLAAKRRDLRRAGPPGRSAKDRPGAGGHGASSVTATLRPGADQLP